jgi:aryl-alcohol dehydrogenase-like predicted oxidoreductase
MKKRPLGRTGLEVSEIGLGGVWFASLGDAPRHGAVIRAAIEAGVNVVDTAPGYKDSEQVVGRGLEGGLRSRVILSTKYYPYGDDGKVAQSGDRMRKSLERSLSRLGTGHLDILHLHWVHSAEDILAIASGELGDALRAERKAGRIRHIAVSEASEMDGEHRMLQAAIPTGLFEVVMVTHNVLLQTAEQSVFPLAARHGTGVLAMMPFNQPMGKMGLINREFAFAGVKRLMEKGALPDRPPYNQPGVMDFLAEGTRMTLPQAALRFVLDRPEVSCALVGTSSLAHLSENLAASSLPSLSPTVTARAHELFGSVTVQDK